jgi:hypothetical protein
MESFYKNLRDKKHMDYFMPRFDGWIDLYKEQIRIISANSLAIADGYGYDDEELMTVLGNSATKTDDDIYELILDTCRKNPLNKHPVAAGFNTFMRPVLLGKL